MSICTETDFLDEAVGKHQHQKSESQSRLGPPFHGHIKESLFALTALAISRFVELTTVGSQKHEYTNA